MIKVRSMRVFNLMGKTYQAPYNCGTVIPHVRQLNADTLLMLLPNPNHPDKGLSNEDLLIWATGDVWTLVKVRYHDMRIVETEELGVYLGEGRALKEYHERQICDRWSKHFQVPPL